MEFIRFLKGNALPVALAIGGFLFLVLDMIGRFEEIMGMPGWAWEALAGLLFVAAIILFFYRIHKRLEGTRDGQKDGATMSAPESAPQYQIYEGAHEKLMNFVVEHIFPVCDARNKAHGEIIKALCPNGPVAELAQYGASRYPNAHQLKGGMDVLEGLSDSPPEFIPFEKMCWAVGHIECGYDVFLSEGDEIARSGYVHPRVAAIVAELWEQWRLAHNAMVAAYEPIKRDSRMGTLFRPARESFWGGIIPPTTDANPLRLMLRDTEADKQR